MSARLLAVFLLLAPTPSLARSALLPGQIAPQAGGCTQAVADAERAALVPERLLTTLSLVESGRPDPVSGRVAAWPWTINAGGTGYFYDSKAQAITAARGFHAAGIASIDVGCMQISLLFHPDAFASLEDAFDPRANAAYGAQFLAALYRQTGNWPAAAAAYHSQTPEIGAAYQQRVMALWPLAGQFPALPGKPAAAPQPRTPPEPDDSQYTPQFRAVLRQIRLDQQRLLAQYGPQPSHTPVSRNQRRDRRPAASPIWTAESADRQISSR